MNKKRQTKKMLWSLGVVALFAASNAWTQMDPLSSPSQTPVPPMEAQDPTSGAIEGMDPSASPVYDHTSRDSQMTDEGRMTGSSTEKTKKKRMKKQKKTTTETTETETPAATPGMAPAAPESAPPANH